MLRLSLVLVLAIVAGCTGGSDSAPRYVGTNGVELELPASWHDAAAATAGRITDPIVRLAVSSGPIQPGSRICLAASYDFPEDEVAIVVVEWTTPLLLRGTRAKPLPKRFTAASLPIHAPPAIECFPGSGGGAQFVEAGRMFAVYVLLGRTAPAELADEARAVLDTLRIGMRTARPVQLVALAQKRIDHCRRSALLRMLCPTRVPRARAPYLSQLARDLLGTPGRLDQAREAAPEAGSAGREALPARDVRRRGSA